MERLSETEGMNRSGDTLIFALAIFAMFFGAGNLIFPPEIGMMSGSEWPLAFTGFFLTGICIPIGGILAFSRAGGADKFAAKVSGRFNTIYFSLLILALGPMLAIPRTAATAYEMGVVPVFGEVNPFIFSGIYTITAFMFVVKPTSIIGNIGRFLTPLILTVLGIIIIKGAAGGLGIPADKMVVQNSFSFGFLRGYQTMDALASVVFSVVILKGLKDSGYREKNAQRTLLIRSGLAAAVSGAGRDFSRIELIMYLAGQTMGEAGIAVLGICVTLACLTTSIALLATVAEFFSGRTPLSYRMVAAVTCMVSTVLAAAGLETIIGVSAPILTILYPATIILIGYNIAGVEDGAVFKGGIGTGLVFSLLEVISSIGAAGGLDRAYKALPLSSEGLAWLLPSIMVSMGIKLYRNERYVRVIQVTK